MNNKQLKYLSKIYNTPGSAAAFGSINELFNSAKKHFPDIQKKDIRNFLQTQRTHTLHKLPRRNKYYRKTISPGINAIHQCDLVDVRQIKNENLGYCYLLTNIDIFTRRACAVPIKTKTPMHVVQAFSEIHKKNGYPRKLHSDKGTEFMSKYVQDYFKVYGIHHYTSYSDTKASLCERFNKTLRRLMFMYMTKYNTLKYIDVLNDLCKSYNNRKHRALGIAPNEVNKNNSAYIWSVQYGSLNKKSPKSMFKVGDTVRLKTNKKLFEKGHIPKWTEELFKIVNILDTNPKTFRIEDVNGERILGHMYANEMQLISNPQT